VTASSWTTCAERLPILLARVGRIMFTRHGEHMRRVETGHHLLDLVELRGCRKVCDVTGADDGIGRVAKAVDLTDGVVERNR
jgi:hypothetical protein